MSYKTLVKKLANEFGMSEKECNKIIYSIFSIMFNSLICETISAIENSPVQTDEQALAALQS